MTPTPEVLTLAAYGVMIAAVTAEVGVAAMQGRRAVLESAATGTAMALGGLLVSVPFAAALAFLWEPVHERSPMADLWLGRPALTAVVAFVVWDGAGWLYHWLGHRTAVGWAAHQPHHTGPGYDLTIGLRQSWLPVHGLLAYPPVALVGFDLATVAVCAAVSSALQFLQHTSAPVPFPKWVTDAVMTPGAHRLHHAGDAVNLGPVLTVWDRLAGTWRPPEPTVLPPVGHISADPNPFRLEAAGWLALWRRSDQPEVGGQRRTADLPGAGRRDRFDDVDGLGALVGGEARSGVGHHAFGRR